MTMSSRIAVMDAGHIRQVAPPAEVYEFPNSRYVATFIGDANIFEGRVERAASDSVTIHSAEAGRLFVDRSVASPVDATVWVAVRPEKIAIAAEPPADASVNCVEGTVFDIGYLGDMSIFHVALAGGRRVRVAQANRYRLVDRAITWSDRVWLTWPPGAGVVLLT